MRGKVVVITGATSGIGRIAALSLAAKGARIVLIARDQARADAMLARLSATGPPVAHRAFLADLSSVGATRRVGQRIVAEEARIDVLINNAGSIFPRRAETVDGLERTFALNHMAYFVLTLALRERLVASAPGRVVNTASRAHLGNVLDFGDLQMRRRYQPLTAYGRSKLANILFTRELARRLSGTGVTANCLHPGFVATGLGQRGGGFFGMMVGLSMLFAGRAEDGAKTIVHLAAAPELATTTGAYFAECREIEPSVAAQDDAAAQRLWQESERLAAACK
jgi:NAD(P)-dependent dehydrogenase (short-subunit alcohol dehydrogenase family)